MVCPNTQQRGKRKRKEEEKEKGGKGKPNAVGTDHGVS
jgi:hypothetical protein